MEKTKDLKGQEHKAFNLETPQMSSEVLQSQSIFTFKQKCTLFVLIITHTISSLFGLGFAFYELVPELECLDRRGDWIICSKEDACAINRDYTYRVNWESQNSIVNMMTEMDLIWESSEKIGILGSLVFFGFLLSGFTIMPTPDIFGRKPVLIVTVFISTLFPLFIIYFQSMTYVYIALFFYGFTVLVRGTTSYVFLIEMVPEELEKKFVSTMIIVEKLMMWTIPFIFYLFKDWKYNITIYAVVSIAWGLYLCSADESPKFIKQQRDTQDNKVESKTTFGDMIKEGSNLKNLLIIICCWSFTSASYYMVCFYIKYFKGSIYLNSFLLGFAGLLGTLIFGYLIERLNKKHMFIISFSITFLGSAGFSLTREHEKLVPLWILLMILSLSLQFSLCYYANWALFPPGYRTRIFSICNIVARALTIASPMLVEVMVNPIFLISISAVVMIIMVTQLVIPTKD